MKERIKIIGLGTYGASIINEIAKQHFAPAYSFVAIDSDCRSLSRVKSVNKRILLGEGKGAIAVWLRLISGLL